MEAPGAQALPAAPGAATPPQGIWRPLPLLLAAFAAGIAAAPQLPQVVCEGWGPWLAAALLALSLAASAIRGRYSLLLPMSLFLAVGLVSAGATLKHRPAANDLARWSGEHLSVLGTVSEAEQRAGGAHRLVVEVEGAWDEQGHRLPAAGRLLVWARGEGALLPEPGQRVRFPARPLPIKGYQNPGCYDVVGKNAREGLFARTSLPLERLERLGARGSPSTYLARLRFEVARLFGERVGGAAGGLCAALAVGTRAGLPRPYQDAFAASGTAHLLSVSGLHLGLVGLLAYGLARRLIARWERLLLRVPAQRVAAVFAFALVLLYALLVGWQTPPVRSAIMAAAALLVLLSGRQSDLWSALALAALLILAIDPPALFEASFQLSFAAVAGLAAAGRRLSGWLRGLPRPLAWTAGLLATTVAATLATAPLVAHHFNQLSLVSPLANLLLVPLVGLALTPLCLAGALLLPASPALAALPLLPAATLARLSLSLVSWLGGLPWAALWLRTPDWAEVALLYGGLLAALLLRGRRLAAAVAVVAVAWPLYGRWADAQANPAGQLSVRYLDVGRGNSSLVVAPKGEAMLIDAPGLEGSDLDLGRAVVARTLWALRVTGLERVIVTHPHPDHAAGLPFVLARFRPRELWLADPEPGLERLAAEVGCRVVRVQAGARGKLGGAAALEVLWPPVRPGPALEVPEDERWEAQNEHSTVLRLTYGGRAFLFPGDIGSPSERALVAGAAPRLAADVLLSPHHGSRCSNTPEFLAAVHPRAAVLSQGPGTYTNWPSAEVLSRLGSCGAALWRTDRDGMVTASTDGRGLRLSGWH